MTDLNALADRVEALDGPCRESLLKTLDLEIYAAISPFVVFGGDKIHAIIRPASEAALRAISKEQDDER